MQGTQETERAAYSSVCEQLGYRSVTQQMLPFHNKIKLDVAKYLIQPIKMALIILKRAIDNLLSLLAAIDVYDFNFFGFLAVRHILIGEEVVLQTVYNALW